MVKERFIPDLTEPEKQLLRDAGASEELIDVCDCDLEEMSQKRRDGKQVPRNSALAEVKKYIRVTDYTTPYLTGENSEEFYPRGGHFFTELWNGNLYKAWSRADPNNRAIMLEVFGEHRINASKPSHSPRINV